MADHFSGPRALSDPATDITDLFAFPSPERPGHVVLVLNTHPLAAPTALFSDAATYRLRVRPVSPDRSGATPAFAVGEDEYAFDFTFAAPTPGDANGSLAQAGICTTPAGEAIPFEVGAETEAQGLRLFAGPRLDPFFIDFPFVAETAARGELTYSPTPSNVLEGANVLSIVLEVDPAAVFGPGSGSLLAVVGDTLTSGTHPVRLERQGRAETKNIIMAPPMFDPVNPGLEIREPYNDEDAFNLSEDQVGAYRARLNANLAFYDGLDGETAWPLDAEGTHPLTELLLADFLVVDPTKPFSEDGFFEIERALLAGRTHTTCGGRSLNENIVDTYYTLVIGGLDGPRISHGVDQATKPAGNSFPYMHSPNPNPPDPTPVLSLFSTVN